MNKTVFTYINPKGTDEAVAKFSATFNKPAELWEDEGVVYCDDPDGHRGTPGDFAICIDPSDKEGWSHVVRDFDDTTTEDEQRDCISRMLKFLSKTTGLTFETYELCS